MTDDQLHDDQLARPWMDLHDRLVDATARRAAPSARRQRTPRSTRSGSYRLMVSAIAAVVLGVGIVGYTLGIGRNDGNAAADVTVQRQGSTVTVSIDEDVTTSEIEKALERAGVTVKVNATPTGPSRVNRFVGIVGPSSAKLVGGDGTVSLTATFVAGSAVQLNLGVPADGRPYDATTVATDPGEPLEGATLVGKQLDEVRSDLEQRAERRHVTIAYLTPAGPVDTPPSGTIRSAQAVAADRVVITVQ